MTTVTISSIIDAPVEKVWARIRDFNGLPSWHPRMVESHIEDGKPATEIGCIRNFTLASGPKLREQLTAFSDDEFLTSYAIVETPQPISSHSATLQLRRVTDGDRTYAEWTATFDAPAEKADELAAGMGANVFQGGFNALQEHFTSKS
ncbi:Polyketide cyclase / dehydrase and lipid transport [Hoeflea sp. IMCC20628]|uniref:SRPBCC family protein n=1 Tax=Hoeflea sp. IMCC20628 TaxID=1620421 RepID=UPI00063AD8B0|nr:SRPBCC family protein [Hoeflea sp. IMCC20628]AKI01900.1 Polyketide cyclase / dehydrase and lipid transport [Hoeflea sp. IMCC20628]